MAFARVALFALLLAGCGQKPPPGSGSGSEVVRPVTAAHQRVTLSRPQMRPLEGGGYAVNFAYLGLPIPEPPGRLRLPPRIMGLAGKNVEVEGHVIALKMADHLITEFLLSKYSLYQCCFGAEPTAAEFVRVVLPGGRGMSPIYDADTVRIRGTLLVAEERDEAGKITAVYRMNDARVLR